MSSDAQQDQMQNLKYQKHLKWNLVSRSSDSGQNCKVSEASEHEVKSRSSDSEQRPLKNLFRSTSEARFQGSPETQIL